MNSEVIISHFHLYIKPSRIIIPNEKSYTLKDPLLKDLSKCRSRISAVSTSHYMASQVNIRWKSTDSYLACILARRDHVPVIRPLQSHYLPNEFQFPFLVE